MAKRQVIAEPEKRQSETELLARIRWEPGNEFRQRYSDLVERCGADALTSEERKELLRLTDQVERWQADRVEALADLVELRKIPVEELLQELNLKPFLND
jgi:hypothetical protein